MAATAIVGQILIVFLLLAVVLYGQWVAMSVAEEKSSRVMEIVISAATPFQLLGGKVIGVGGLGIVQLLAAAIPGHRWPSSSRAGSPRSCSGRRRRSSSCRRS